MNRLLAAGLVFLAFLLLLVNINKPFIGQHDWNGVVYGQQAKNFYRFGYFPLKFGATLATADANPDERKYSVHYTPALPVLISLSYRIFGISEASTRLVPVIASLFSVALVVALGKELISFRAGITAGALMALTPMFIYYGKNPVHEIVLLPFALLSFFSYLRFKATGKNFWWNISLPASVAAMLIGWPGYYVAGLIFIHGILTWPKEKFKFFQLPLSAVILLIVFFSHSLILNPQVSGDLRNILFARLGGASVGLIDFFTRELRYSINLFTVSLLSLSSIWFISRSKNKSVLLSLGLFGLAHILIFRQAGYYHEYLLFPLLPFVAITSAGTVENLFKLFQGLKIKILISGLVLSLVAGERLGYLQALLKSEYVRDVYEEAVEYGKIIRVNPGMTVPIERDVYFIFYADTVLKK